MFKIIYLLLLGSLLPLLAKESFGVAVNPIRLLISNSDWRSYSGTLSYFNDNTGTEISIPIFYEKDKKRYYYRRKYSDSTETLNVDLRYRKYMDSKLTEGFYVGAFGRYTYLDGKSKNSMDYVTVKKFGVGVDIGVKKKHLWNTPLYWGASLSVGGYMGNSDDKLAEYLYGLGFDDDKLILEIELLKVGYEF